MKRSLVLALACACLPLAALAQSQVAEPQAAIAQFERGLQQRKLALIEQVVAPDIVVLENGERNNGWPDFRDNHLVPEMAEPATPAQPELLRIHATSDMAWAYTRTTFASARRGQKREITVWSAYVLERRPDGWKIVLLDWSVGSRPLP